MAQRTFHAQPMRRARAALAVAWLLCCCQPAWSNINIEIKGVNEELRANVLAYLSFERYRKSESLSADTLERLHNRVEREVAAALKPFGYYEPRVRSELHDLGHGDWRVNVDIDPGPPVVMRSVDVNVRGPGATDPLFQHITANLPLHPGERLSHAAYDRLKGDLQRTAATYGYLDARLLKNELQVDPERREANAVLELETGPRYRFGNTRIEQNTIADTLVRRFIRYEQDDPFDMTELLRTQFALDDSQYFASVEVLPGEPDRNEHIVPISIRAEANRRTRYSFAAGYGTDTSVRGTIAWEVRRVNDSGHRFNVQLQLAASQTQSLQSHYTIPIGDPALEKLDFETTVEKKQLADLNTRDFKFGPSITHVRGRWQTVWFVTADNTTTTSAIENHTDHLLIPGMSIASVPQGYLGEALFSRGFFAQLRGSTSALGSTSDFLQLDIQAERVFNLTRVWHLLLRGELGASLVAHLSTLPGSLRFFAGGDRSVRGFAYNDLSPTQPVLDAQGNPVLDIHGNPETVKVGGKDLVTGTVEFVRDLPRNFGVAVFVDVGNAFDRFGDPLEYSAGLGFRWRLPVLTLGVDVAQPLSTSAGPRLHINFSPKL